MRIGLGIGIGMFVGGGVTFAGTVPECSPDVPAPTWHLWEVSDEIDVVLWLRADLGVTKDGSDLVSEWRDQSASGLVFTAAGGARPTWKSAEIGGRDSIRGDGSTDIMISTGTLNLAAASGFTWFGVMKDTSAGGVVAFEVGADVGANDGLGIIPNNGGAGNIFMGANGASAMRYANLNGTGSSLASAAVVTYVHDSTQTGAAQIVGLVNGAVIGHVLDSGADSGAGFGNANVHLFARAGAVAPWPGDFSEIILFASAVDATKRQRVTRNLGALYSIATS